MSCHKFCFEASHESGIASIDHFWSCSLWMSWFCTNPICLLFMSLHAGLSQYQGLNIQISEAILHETAAENRSWNGGQRIALATKSIDKCFSQMLCLNKAEKRQFLFIYTVNAQFHNSGHHRGKTVDKFYWSIMTQHFYVTIAVILTFYLSRWLRSEFCKKDLA